MRRTRTPVLYAWKHPDGVHWIAWCPYCARYHWHSAGAGHRVAHCHTEESPFSDTGYVLIGGARAPDAVLRRVRPWV